MRWSRWHARMPLMPCMFCRPSRPTNCQISIFGAQIQPRKSDTGYSWDYSFWNRVLDFRSSSGSFGLQCCLDLSCWILYPLAMPQRRRFYDEVESAYFRRSNTMGRQKKEKGIVWWSLHKSLHPNRKKWFDINMPHESILWHHDIFSSHRQQYNTDYHQETGLQLLIIKGWVAVNLFHKKEVSGCKWNLTRDFSLIFERFSTCRRQPKRAARSSSFSSSSLIKMVCSTEYKLA